jgi:hypothetical protein
MKICRSFEGLWLLDGAEGFCRQEEDGGYEGEGSVDDEAEEAEGEQDEPDERVEDEEGQREGPAEKGQDAEEKKIQHEDVAPVMG